MEKSAKDVVRMVVQYFRHMFYLKSGSDWVPGWRFYIPSLECFGSTETVSAISDEARQLILLLTGVEPASLELEQIAGVDI